MAACLATLKWTEGNLFSLIAHWVHCYRTARSDSAFLPRCLWVTYEDLVRNPYKMLARIWQFVGLEPEAPAPFELRDDNAKYFDLWREKNAGWRSKLFKPLQPFLQRWAKKLKTKYEEEQKKGKG